jgi:3-dehydroquinate dehydratase type I
VSGARLCLTGTEATTAELAERLARPADLHEVRLDHLDALDDAVYGLLRRHAGQLVATCRPPDEGGAFEGTETERLGLLRRAAEAGVRWLDLELTALEQGAAEVVLAGIATPPAVIASVHDFDGRMQELDGLVQRLDACEADAAKLAIAVRDPVHVEVLRGLRFHHAQQVVIGMGAAGIWTRLRPSEFGSMWTYAAARRDLATAPGQVDAVRARRLRVVEHDRLLPVALIGPGSVARAPLCDVLCAALAEREAPYQVLPMPIPRGRTLADVPWPPKLAGLAVTAPFNREAAERCDELDSWARESGTVDAVAVDDDGTWRGSNTLAAAAAELGLRGPTAGPRTRLKLWSVQASLLARTLTSEPFSPAELADLRTELGGDLD